MYGDVSITVTSIRSRPSCLSPYPDSGSWVVLGSKCFRPPPNITCKKHNNVSMYTCRPPLSCLYTCSKIVAYNGIHYFHDFLITNTVFKLPNRNKTSWMHPRSKHWHLIDYVIVRRTDRQYVRVTKTMCRLPDRSQTGCQQT